MLKYKICGCEKKEAVPNQIIILAGLCYQCRKQYIGQRITFLRFGDAPEEGRSYNYAENKYEAGLSVYLVLDGKIAQTVRCEFDGRTAYTGTGIMVDTGGDDEPVVIDYEMEKITKKKLRTILT